MTESQENLKENSDTIETTPENQAEDGGEEAHGTQPKNAKTLRQKSIYLIPNLFTLAALFASFYGILLALNVSIMGGSNYKPAALAIFIAMILDGMDGRAARKLNAQSEFGAQLDSLADMVSFGVAPAIVAYTWQLHHFEFGWAIAFIYCACAAMRLALFNILIGVVDKRWFVGVPSPTAAALVAGLIWISYDAKLTNHIGSNAMQYISLFMVLYAGISMVVPFKFWSFKDLHPRREVPFYFFFIPILAFIIFIYAPSITLFALFVIYSLSGYLMTLWNVFVKKQPWPNYPTNSR